MCGIQENMPLLRPSNVHWRRIGYLGDRAVGCNNYVCATRIASTDFESWLWLLELSSPRVSAVGLGLSVYAGPQTHSLFLRMVDNGLVVISLLQPTG